MIDDSKNIVTALKTILPVYYEQFINDQDSIPCITYAMSNNTVKTPAQTGAKLTYSDIGYDIKLWAKSKSDIETYSSQIDETMKTLGYSLSGGREMLVGNLICLVMVFNGVGFTA